MALGQSTPKLHLGPLISPTFAAAAPFSSSSCSFYSPLCVSWLLCRGAGAVLMEALLAQGFC